MNQKFNLIRKIPVVLVLIAAVTGFSSCVKYSFPLPSVSTVDTLYFSTDIEPIFTSNNCTSCHPDLEDPDLRTGKSFQSLTDLELINLPGETSRLYVWMTTDADHIPRSGVADKQKVLIWINQGALNN